MYAFEKFLWGLADQIEKKKPMEPIKVYKVVKSQ